jgi:quinol monooxygenase YgiN
VNDLIAMHVLFRCPPGTSDELIRILDTEMRPRVADEPGTLEFGWHRSASDDDLVWLYELYQGEEGVAAHRANTRHIVAKLIAVAGEPEEIVGPPVWCKVLAPGD